MTISVSGAEPVYVPVGNEGRENGPRVILEWPAVSFPTPPGWPGGTMGACGTPLGGEDEFVCTIYTNRLSPPPSSGESIDLPVAVVDAMVTHLNSHPPTFKVTIAAIGERGRDARECHLVVSNSDVAVRPSSGLPFDHQQYCDGLKATVVGVDMCVFTDAGDGSQIKAKKGSVFTDSRGKTYGAGENCELLTL